MFHHMDVTVRILLGKALIRSVSSENTETKTVRYNTLRPLASPRPSRMHSVADISEVTDGHFVFFSTLDSPDVKAGLVQNVQDGKCTIQEHRQGSTLRRRSPVAAATAAATALLVASSASAFCAASRESMMTALHSASAALVSAATALV